MKTITKSLLDGKLFKFKMQFYLKPIKKKYTLHKHIS